MVNDQVPYVVGSFAIILCLAGLLVLAFQAIRMYNAINKLLETARSKPFWKRGDYEKSEVLRGISDTVPFGLALQAHLDSLVSAPWKGTQDVGVKVVEEDPEKSPGQGEPTVPHTKMQVSTESAHSAGEQSTPQPISMPGARGKLRSRLQAPVSAKFTLARANNINHWLWSDTLRHCPGILTGVGIVGTFYGIYQGLQKMQKSLTELGGTDPAKQVEVITKAVEQLFGHVSPAFLASMICVILAVVFTLIEKVCFKTLHEHATNLAVELDRHFPVIQTETILLNISERSDQTSSDLRSALSEIVAGQIEQSLKNLLEHQETQTKQLAALLGSSISNAINDRLAPMADNLREAVEQINRKSETSSNEAMKLMVQDFQKALTGSAGSEMDSLSKNLKQAAEMMAGQNSAMSTFADKMKQHLQEQGQAQKEQQEVLAKQFSDTLTHIKTALNQMAEETAKTSKAGISVIGDEVNRLLQRSLHMQETSEAKIRDAIDQTGKGLSDQIVRFQMATSDQIKHMSVAVAGVSSTVEEVSQKLTVSAANMAATLNDSTRASMTEMSVQMNTATQKAIELLTERVTASLSNMETNTTTLMRATAQSQENLSTSTSSLAKTISDSTRASLTEMSTQMSTATQKAVEFLTERVSASLSNIETNTTSLMRATEQSQENLTTSASSMAKTISDSTRASLTEMSTQMSTATQKAVELLTERVTASLSNMETNTTSLMRATAQSQEHLTASTSSLAEKISDSTRASMAEMSTQMNTATQKAIDLLTERVTSSLSSMEAKTTSLMSATAESQQNLVRQLSALSDKIATVSNSSTESTLAVANRTRETVNALDAMSVKLEALLGKLEPVGLGFTTAGDRLLEATANLRVHSEKSAAQNELTTKLLTQVGQIHTQLQQQLSLHDMRLESLKDATSSMQQTVDSLTTVNAQVGQSLTQLTQNSERVFHSISEKHAEHGRQVAELLKTYLSQFDKSVAGSCAGLQAIVEELNSALEEFREDQKAEQRK